MTDTTTILTESHPEAVTSPDTQAHPSDILMNLIITFLAPMFLCASGGDVGFARMAAIKTVSAYRARDLVDLMSIAQLIGFSLTALGSLSLSMADDISLSMTLRLRGNAVALNRATEQNRLALAKHRIDSPIPQQTGVPPEPGPDPEAASNPDQDALIASVAQAQKRAADTQAAMRAAQPAPIPATATTPAPTTPAPTTPAPTTAAPITARQQNQAAWATAMAEAAAKLTAGIPHLPPAERTAASLKAAALVSTANNLLSGLGSAPPDPISASLTALPGAVQTHR